MADEATDEKEEAVVEKEDDVVEEGTKKAGLGLVSGLLVTILKIAGLILVVVLVSVATSFIIYNTIGKRSTATYYTSVEDFRGTQQEQYDWYEPTEGNGLKGVTNDSTRKSFMIKLNIAYPLGDDGILNELIQKRVPITDILLSWFGSKSAEYLRNIDNREKIRGNIKNQLKQLMTSTDSIKDIRFSEYQILDS